MGNDKIVLLIVTFIMGGILAGFGAIIKTQNAGDMINGFDDRRDDKGKVSKIMGTAMVYTGLLVILLGLVGLFLKEKYLAMIPMIQIVVVCVGVGIGGYRTNKYGKKCI